MNNIFDDSYDDDELEYDDNYEDDYFDEDEDEDGPDICYDDTYPDDIFLEDYIDGEDPEPFYDYIPLSTKSDSFDEEENPEEEFYTEDYKRILEDERNERRARELGIFNFFHNAMEKEFERNKKEAQEAQAQLEADNYLRMVEYFKKKNEKK